MTDLDLKELEKLMSKREEYIFRLEGLLTYLANHTNVGKSTKAFIESEITESVMTETELQKKITTLRNLQELNMDKIN